MEEGRPSCRVPHTPLKVTFRWTLFPPWTKHIPVLFWHTFNGVGDRTSGVLPSALGPADLCYVPQAGLSPQVRGKWRGPESEPFVSESLV